MVTDSFIYYTELLSESFIIYLSWLSNSSKPPSASYPMREMFLPNTDRECSIDLI